jgi:hypothetical protein
LSRSMEHWKDRRRCARLNCANYLKAMSFVEGENPWACRFKIVSSLKGWSKRSDDTECVSIYARARRQALELDGWFAKATKPSGRTSDAPSEETPNLSTTSVPDREGHHPVLCDSLKVRSREKL